MTEAQKDDGQTYKDIHELVLTTVREMNQLILDRISHRPEKERWLLKSRIINTIFQMHYVMTYKAAEKRVEKDEQAP